jgi:hypothetical protein
METTVVVFQEELSTDHRLPSWTFAPPEISTTLVVGGMRFCTFGNFEQNCRKEQMLYPPTNFVIF